MRYPACVRQEKHSAASSITTILEEVGSPPAPSSGAAPGIPRRIGPSRYGTSQTESGRSAYHDIQPPTDVGPEQDQNRLRPAGAGPHRGHSRGSGSGGE